MRPLRQRALAGLLAVTFTVSSCGDAFDASPQNASKTASAGITRDEGLPIGRFTDSIDAEDLEAGKLAKGPTAKNLSDGIPLDQCAITRTYTLQNLTWQHKQNIERFWIKQSDHDELRRRLTMHSESHPGTQAHARSIQNHFPGVFNHRTNFTIKFHKISEDKAVFLIKVYAPGNRYPNGISRAQCRALGDNFRQIQSGNGRTLKADQGIEATWTQVFVSTFVGAVVGLGTTALVVFNSQERYHAYVTPNALCVGSTVGTLIYMIWTGQISNDDLVSQRLGAILFGCAVANAGVVTRIKAAEYRKYINAMTAAAAAATAASGIPGAQAVDLGSREIQGMLGRTAQAALTEIEIAIGRGDIRVDTGSSPLP